MSEFFRALEQAERDRLRQEGDAPAAVPPSASRTVTRDRTPEPEPPAEKIVASSAAAEATVAPSRKKTVSEPLPTTPPPPPPRPVAAKPPLVRASVAATPPASVFRPSLQADQRSRSVGRPAPPSPLLRALTDPNSVEADAYRTVRANIELMSDNGAFRHIVVTSAAGGDGKSTTAANLAVVAAQGGRRVCVVDADFRRPALHDVFGLGNIDGLALALEQGQPLDAVAKPSDIANLSVVVTGRGPHEPVHDLLTPQRLSRLLAASEGAFDFVVFDGPPVVVADTLSLAAACGGVIVVVRAGSIPFAVLRRSIAQIRQVKGRVLGVLLNQADLRLGDTDSYYRGYHAKRAMS